MRPFKSRDQAKDFLQRQLVATSANLAMPAALLRDVAPLALRGQGAAPTGVAAVSEDNPERARVPTRASYHKSNASCHLLRHSMSAYVNVRQGREKLTSATSADVFRLHVQSRTSLYWAISLPSMFRQVSDERSALARERVQCLEAS